MTAQVACEKGEFATLDEARAAQTRASIAQSHAIHAAVVEHEARTVKRRSTLALANDVRTWNIHRKREMLQSCLTFAKSQHEATRRAVDAWSSLRDGFIGTPVNPSVVERRLAAPQLSDFAHISFEPRPLIEPGEVTATIYGAQSSCSESRSKTPSIVAVDHNILTSPGSSPVASDKLNSFEQETSEPESSIHEPEMILPFAEAAPIPEETVEDLVCSHHSQEYPPMEQPFIAPAQSASFHEPGTESGTNDEKLSASMQSLVEGLMNWGGGFDTEEDHFALPLGMAASIVLEENNIFGKN
jgi:hypothetical protein